MRTILGALIFASLSFGQTVTIGSAVFIGSGLNDATSGGHFTTAPGNHTYVAIISATGTPDHFTWTKDGGSASSPVAITGATQNLTDGVTIKFSATTGHTLANSWTITATASGSGAGSSLISPGFGAQFRSVQARARDTVSVLDFAGVDPNGVADSCAGPNGMQAAINYAISTGKNLYAPAGTYLCNTATSGLLLNILSLVNNMQTPGTVGGFSFEGAGLGKTIIYTTNVSASNTLMAAISSGTGFFPSYELRGFTLQGPSSPSACMSVSPPATSPNGLRISGTSAPYVHLTDILVTGFCGNGARGIWLDNAEMFKIDHVRADYSYIGAYISTASNASVVDNLTVDQNQLEGLELPVNGLASTTFNSLLVQSNWQFGLVLRSTINLVFNATHFENNGASGNGAQALVLDATGGPCSYNTFIGLIMTTAADTIFMGGNATAGHTASHNTFLGMIDQHAGTITINDAFSQGNIWSGVNTAAFVNPPTHEIFLDSSGAFSSAVAMPLFPGLSLQPFTAATLPGCSGTSPNPGQLFYVVDLLSNVPNSLVGFVGGGTNKGIVACSPTDANYFVVWAHGEPIITSVTAGLGISVTPSGSSVALATSGATNTVTVRNAAGTGTCTIAFTAGVYTGGTC